MPNDPLFWAIIVIGLLILTVLILAIRLDGLRDEIEKLKRRCDNNGIYL